MIYATVNLTFVYFAEFIEKMDLNNLKSSIEQYKQQLEQINFTISKIDNGPEKDDLITLKADIEQLINLTEENLETVLENQKPSTSSSSNDPLQDEYEQFLKEMEKEGAVEISKANESKNDVEDDFKSLEGMKCQAPHEHSWGDTVYHNAMVCGVVSADEKQEFNEIQVRVMFTNPTHREMLPCPYYLGGECKFTEERCKFSHGESVLLSQLQEYKEPNFSSLKIGTKVLAKRSNNLWQRAILKKLETDECTIKFESSKEEYSVPLDNILPMDDTSETDSSSDESSDEEEQDNDFLIQKSLLTLQPSEKMGDWEKHTKGIGSKLMEQMGYVIGTGLGRRSDGRLEPVQAVILPAGKSLDHCMTLRENAGGDQNLFSVEKKLKKLQKQQEIRNQKAYEREKNKKDVFEFLNDTLVLSKNKNTINGPKSKNKHRQEIKTDSNRDLNVASLKIDEDIRRVENELIKIRTTLTRHNNPDTAINKNLRAQLQNKQQELKRLHDYSKNLSNEQSLRKDKKKMTVF